MTHEELRRPPPLELQSDTCPSHRHGRAWLRGVANQTSASASLLRIVLPVLPSISHASTCHLTAVRQLPRGASKAADSQDGPNGASSGSGAEKTTCSAPNATNVSYLDFS